jgi:lipid A ethanolaminephosphotransferase
MVRLPARLRPMLRVETLLLAVLAWLIATANGAWWAALGAGRDWTQPRNWLLVCCCFVALVAVHFAVLAPLMARRIARPLLSVIVLVTSIATYYMSYFAVLLDPSMIRNVLRTDAREAHELLGGSLLLWLLLWCPLPLAFIWWVRLRQLTPLRASAVRAASVLAALLVALGSVLLVSRDLVSFMRNEKQARYLITPGNYLYGLAVNSLHTAADARTPRATVAADARLLRVALSRPRVLLLVVGETARAANFSLLGYPRETNPELARANIIAFHDVTSCGTSTEVSVPCMFSPFGRENYDERRIRNSESLLDVLVRAGYAVRWLDNQSGCKGVCQGPGVEYEKPGAALAPELCDRGECHDEILARRLESLLPDVTTDTVFVLHMMGNHGPAYFRRYPREFRRFLPECATAQLRDCSRAAVVNTYDNAILYTDHVLALVIRALRQDPRGLHSAMIYVSDHGESLGEHGLYLHGLPYAIAPDVQTHVPLIAWISPRMAASDVDIACLRGKSRAAWSHDNLFHSVLGLLDVQTTVYRASHDIFDGCRATSGAALAQTELPASSR